MIRIDGISKTFDDKIIFKNFSLDIEENKITGILGPSGIGKTTLINIISGIWKADSGQIIGFDTKDLSFIFQEPRLLPWLTVYDNIDYVLKTQFKDKSQRREIILRNLLSVGLEDSIHLFPSDLSGGMMQRLSIARAFAYPSNILIMDEPFKGLDINLKKNVMNAFINIWSHSKKTVIFVTHDIDEIIALVDTVHIIADNPVKVKYTQNIDLDIHQRNLESNCKAIKETIIKELTIV